jgi:hypothetical protein
MTLSSQYNAADDTTAAAASTMLVADMSTDGITVLLAKGGKPGLGNQIMAGSRRHKSMVCDRYTTKHTYFLQMFWLSNTCCVTCALRIASVSYRRRAAVLHVVHSAFLRLL